MKNLDERELQAVSGGMSLLTGGALGAGSRALLNLVLGIVRLAGGGH